METIQTSTDDAVNMRSDVWESIYSAIDSVGNMTQKTELTEATRIKDDLGVSSLDMISMLFVLEDKYDINLVKVAPERLVTLGDVVDHVIMLTMNREASTV